MKFFIYYQKNIIKKMHFLAIYVIYLHNIHRLNA
jgi:hypothetical protein